MTRGFIALLFLFSATAIPQAPDTYSLRMAGCVAKDGFDNSTCIAKALNLGNTTGAAVLCGNAGNTSAPAVYGYSSPIAIQLTKSLRFYGVGQNGCTLQFTGTASDTSAAFKVWAAYSAGSAIGGSEISHIRFTTCVKVLAVVQFDQLAKLNFDDYMVRLADSHCPLGGGTYGTPTFAGGYPKNMILGRGWQISTISRGKVGAGALRGMRLESLARVEEYDAGTTYPNGFAVSYGGVGYASLQSSNTGHTPVAGTTTAWWAPIVTTAAVASGASTISVSPNCTTYPWFSTRIWDVLMFANGTYIRGASCSGTTLTIDTCNISGYDGTDKCIGDEQTPVTVTAGNVEPSGAAIQVGFGVVSDVTSLDGWYYGTDCAVSNNQPGRAKFIGNNYLVAAPYGVCNNGGSVDFDLTHFEANTTYDIYQTGGVTGLTNLLNTDIVRANFQGSGMFFAHNSKCTSGSCSITTSSSLLRGEWLDGQIADGATLSIGTTTNLCNNKTEFGGYKSASNTCSKTPFTVTPFRGDGNTESILLKTPAPFAWDSGTTYAIGDQVSYSAHNYIAIASSTNQVPPNASYWSETFGGGIKISNTGDMTWFPIFTATTSDPTPCYTSGTSVLVLYAGPGCSGAEWSRWSGANGGTLTVPNINPTTYRNFPGGAISCPATQHIASLTINSAGAISLYSCN